MLKYRILSFRSISLLLLFVVFGDTVQSQTHKISNDTFWNTQEGTPIYSQGGGIFKFPDPITGMEKYYWYGVHYQQAEAYRKDPSITQERNDFESVTCYSSTDLVNWHFEGDVLTKEELARKGSRPTWLGRLGVAYIPELKKYALFVQHGGKVLITLADSPTSAFSWHQEIDMTHMIGTSNTGDQTVFTDEDTGKSYLIYSYGRGRNKIYVSEIGVKDHMVNLLDCTKVYQGLGREGNCLFKYKNKYYMCASNLYGWDASYAYYLVADDIRGPYTPTNNMLVMSGVKDDFSHITQTGFFYTVKGSKQETVIFCGDRWADFAGNGLGYNQWNPLSFNGDKPYFNSLSSWELNAKTGEWHVADDNNYVKNGSFEADRRSIPSPVKPIQKQLTGWKTVVIKGDTLSFDEHSPKLNHMNTNDERKIVVGEKSLNISDQVDFSRKVFQMINSTPFVSLEDGDYTLAMKLKNSNGFSKLEIYAMSGGKMFTSKIKKKNPKWKAIQLKHIKVKNGKVEIGFLVDGKANAFCLVDDVSLIKD